jgi:hypothetical protein
MMTSKEKFGIPDYIMCQSNGENIPIIIASCKKSDVGDLMKIKQDQMYIYKRVVLRIK